MTSRAILAVDEGTTGTRASLVYPDGRVEHQEYRRLHVVSPQPGVVEQDAMHVLVETLDAMRSVAQQASSTGTQIAAVALATQRSTVVLWDSQTGQPLVPAMVWQDTRYSKDLSLLAPDWDSRLIPIIGRGVGTRSAYLWAVRHLEQTPSISQAHRQGRLRFGSIDTWLLWNLSADRNYAASATNATACGALDLKGFRYHIPWLEELGFPIELLPELVDDAAELGVLRADVIGSAVPITALIGDQHAAMIGLGCVARGQSMVVHGTGSFADLLTGEQFPPKPDAYPATLTLTAWRERGHSTFSVETFTPSTGAALNWLCEEFRWFDSPQQISELAGLADGPAGMMFLPAITGLRSPVMRPEVGAFVNGVTMAHGREQLAYAILEGIAHSVAQSLEANAETADMEPREIVVGGGLSNSDVLMQCQADLYGVPMRRRSGAADATMRGAAFLAGTNGLIWDSLSEAVNCLEPGCVFESMISNDEREERRAQWRSRISHEVELAREVAQWRN